jgi:hypothetical protein
MAVVHSLKTINGSDLKYTGMTVGAIMDMYAAVSMDSSPADILSGVLASCAPEFDMATSPYQDSALLYVNILASTIGERITLNYSCSCGFKFGVDIDLSKVEVSNKENGPGTFIDAESRVWQLQYPPIDKYLRHKHAVQQNNLSIIVVTASDFVNTIDGQPLGENKIDELLALELDDLGKLLIAIDEQPDIELTLADVVCPSCGTEHTGITLRGLLDFFESP